MDSPSQASPVSAPAAPKPRLLRLLGAGLISGSADDDPVAIGTYSQAGTNFGYALSWMPLLCLPILAIVQEISARVGRATGQGLAGNICRQCPRWLVYL